jgi:hypothetical protein
MKASQQNANETAVRKSPVEGLPAVSPGVGHRDPFSKMSHFAEVLIPSFLGVTYLIFSEGFSSWQFFNFGLVVLGLGSALALLYGIELVEKLEDRN